MHWGWFLHIFLKDWVETLWRYEKRQKMMFVGDLGKL